MKLNKSFLYAALAVVVISCQKEIDRANSGSGGGGTTSGLLIKITEKTGADSTTVEYSYDAAKRLSREKVTGRSGTTNLDNGLRIVRNGSGIITQTIQKAAALAGSGIDSVITRYNYSGGRYTSSVFQLTLFGFTVSDSTVYKYDAAGKISSDEHYQAFTGSPYELGLKQEYTYSATGVSVVSVKQYSYDAGTSTFELIAGIDYTYDSKVNPLRLNTSNEGVILQRPSLVSSGNALTAVFTDPSDPTNNFSTTNVYTYNTSGKPTKAVSTESPSGTVSNITYTYQ